MVREPLDSLQSLKVETNIGKGGFEDTQDFFYP